MTTSNSVSRKRGICVLIGYGIDHSKGTLESFATKQRTIMPITSRNITPLLITGRFVPSISYKNKISRHYLCKGVFFRSSIDGGQKYKSIHRQLQTNTTTNNVISKYKAIRLFEKDIIQVNNSMRSINQINLINLLTYSV